MWSEDAPQITSFFGNRGNAVVFISMNRQSCQRLKTAGYKKSIEASVHTYKLVKTMMFCTFLLGSNVNLVQFGLILGENSHNVAFVAKIL